MMIKMKGPVVPDEHAWVYEWFDMDCICPSQISDALDEADGDVILEINSPGGSCLAAFEIYNRVKSHEGKVTAHILWAASAASFIACACDEVLMGDGSMMMIHNTQGIAEGDYREMDHESDVLKEFNKAILNAYKRKTGKDERELKKIMDKESWYSPQEAIAEGFADGWIHGEFEVTDIAASVSPIIPTAKINELKNLIMGTDRFKESVIEGKFSIENDGSLSPEELALAIFGDAEIGGDAFQNTTNNTSENGGRVMTLNEFLAENPEAQAELDALVADRVDSAKVEAVDAARQEGVEAENARLRELDEIANSVTPEALANAKYGENRVDAKTLAYEAMKNEQTQRADYMKNALEDAEPAGEVGADPEEEQEENEDANAMASYVNKKKEGK